MLASIFMGIALLMALIWMLIDAWQARQQS